MPAGLTRSAPLPEAAPFHPGFPVRTPWSTGFCTSAATAHGGGAGTVALIALLVLSAHIVTNLVSPYGLNSDELLYLAMGQHLRLFAMDFPPLIAIIARAERALGGDALWVIRMAPALAHAALVLLAARVTRAVGGCRSAALLAALIVATAPLHLRTGAMFQPVILDQLWWSLGLYALLRLSTGADAPHAPRWWLLLGAAMGLGLLTKFSILFIGLGVVIAIFATPLRAALRTRWPWLALLLALGLGAPSIIGQIRLGWPVHGQMADLQSQQLVLVTRAWFLAEQLSYGPLAVLAAVGLVWCWRHARAVAIACLVPFGVLLLMYGKGYYIGPIYPVLASVGAAWIELPVRRWAPLLRRTAGAALIAFAIVVLPMGLPILSPAVMARYVARLRIGRATSSIAGAVMPLPQDYADMLGWETIVRQTATAYEALPPAERARAVLIARNYGEAAAIDFYGPRYGLPNALCPCGTYWFYGPGSRAGSVAVTIGVRPADLAETYRDVQIAAVAMTPEALRSEQAVPIGVAREPYQTLQERWPALAGRN